MLRYSQLCLLWLLFASVSANDAVNNEKFNKREVSLRRRILDETPATKAAGQTVKVEEVTTTPVAVVETPKQAKDSATGDGDNRVVADTPAKTSTESKKVENTPAEKAITQSQDVDDTAEMTTVKNETPQTPADVEQLGGEGTKIDVTGGTAGAGNEQQTPPSSDAESGKSPGPSEKLKDACADATNCKDCQTAGRSAKISTQGDICLWKVEEAVATCKLASQSEAPKGDMCPATNTSTAQGPNGDGGLDDDEGGGSSFTMVVGFLAVVLLGGAAYRFRKNAARFGDGEDGKSTAVSDFGSILGSTASRSTYIKSETVPLALSSPDDDEEWGWEDSSTGGNGNDVEMTAKNDDQDLTMAFSISQTRPPAAKASSVVRPKSSPAVSRPMSNVMSSTPYSTTATPTMPTMQITSLGLKKASGVGLAKKKPMKKKKEDDLFASMGLAAKPTFSQVSKTKGPEKSKSSVLAAMDMGEEADWDDDGDLDDLLKD